MTLQDCSQDQVEQRGNTPKVADLALNFSGTKCSLRYGEFSVSSHLDIHGDSYMTTEYPMPILETKSVLIQLAVAYKYYHRQSL